MTPQIAIRQCKKNLDFSPHKPWPESLPAFCFRNELLCGFNRESGFAISLDEKNLIEILYDLYPDLSFIELCRLSSKIRAFENSRDPGTLIKKLWQIYGYQYRDSLELVVEKVLQLPTEAQAWLQEKKMAPQDLAPLRSLTDLNQLDSFWSILSTSPHSKSEGVKIIEWLIELILLNHPMDQLLPLKPGAAWVTQLQALRYPQSNKQDLHAETKIRSLAWPLRSEARWARKGDRSGVELKLFFSHPQELKRALERLDQVRSDLESHTEYEDLWSKN